jgi:hypothetical protein
VGAVRDLFTCTSKVIDSFVIDSTKTCERSIKARLNVTTEKNKKRKKKRKKENKRNEFEFSVD